MLSPVEIAKKALRSGRPYSVESHTQYLLDISKSKDILYLLQNIINAYNTNPDPVHYKIRDAIQKAQMELDS